MNSRQQQLYATLGVACLLAGCGANTPTAGSQPGTNPAPPASSGSAPPATAAAAAAPKNCQSWLDVINSDDPHLRETARVRFSGPTQDGDFRLKAMLNPSGKHNWTIKDYDMTLDDPVQKIYYADVDVKGVLPEHDEESTHTYRITVTEFDNGCPSKAMFHTDKHPSANLPTDHGGDAELD